MKIVNSGEIPLFLLIYSNRFHQALIPVMVLQWCSLGPAMARLPRQSQYSLRLPAAAYSMAACWQAAGPHRLRAGSKEEKLKIQPFRQLLYPQSSEDVRVARSAWRPILRHTLTEAVTAVCYDGAQSVTTTAELSDCGALHRTTSDFYIELPCLP